MDFGSFPNAEAHLARKILVGDFDNDGDIDITDIRSFIGQLRAGTHFDLSYDFNQDNTVNALDARALMSQCTRARCAN